MAVTLTNMVDEVRSELQEPDADFFTPAEIERWINYAIKDFCRSTHMLKGKENYNWVSSTQEVSIGTVIDSTSYSRPQIERALWSTYALADSGTATSTTNNKLVDSNQNFTSTVTTSMLAYNTTDNVFSTITAVDNDTTLSLGTNIMTSGEGYKILTLTSATGTVPLIVDVREVWTREPDRHIESNDTESTPTHLYVNIHENKVGLYPTPDNEGTLTVYFSYEPADLSDANPNLDTALERFWQEICQWAVAAGKRKDVDHYSGEEANRSEGRYHRAITKARLDLYRRANSGLMVNFVSNYPAP